MSNARSCLPAVSDLRPVFAAVALTAAANVACADDVSPAATDRFIDPPLMTSEEVALVDRGAELYRHCSACHGGAAAGGAAPDLRYGSAAVHAVDTLARVVFGGGDQGHPSAIEFSEILGTNEIAAIRAYVLYQAHSNYEAELFLRRPADVSE